MLFDHGKPTYLNFDIDEYPWKPAIDYRQHPELYRVGIGEQGVLICELYKSEIGQHWRFRTEEIAKESSQKIFNLFQQYLNGNDFVGADMARKYLQMGFTRARRYANYKGGRKYDKEKNYEPLERGTGEAEKAAAAAVCYEVWQHVEANETYSKLKASWKHERG